MITFQSGEVILAAIPFIGGGGAKRRPLLVLIDTGDSDIIVAPISSQAAQAHYEVALQEWQIAGLVGPSVARVHKVTVVEKQLVTRRLGKLTTKDWARVRTRVKRLWANI